MCILPPVPMVVAVARGRHQEVGGMTPHNAVLTVASLPWAGPARPYFLITFMAGPWEPPWQAGGPGLCGAHRHMGHVVEGGGHRGGW